MNGSRSMSNKWDSERVSSILDLKFGLHQLDHDFYLSATSRHKRVGMWVRVEVSDAGARMTSSVWIWPEFGSR